MLKKIAVPVLFVACVVFAAEEADSRSGLSLGRAHPVSPEVLKDYWKPGYFLGYSETGEVYEWLDAGAYVEFGYFGFDDQKYNEDHYGYASSDNGIFETHIDILTRFYIPGFKIPYVSAAAGLFGWLAGGSEYEIYGLQFSFGAGINIPLGNSGCNLTAEAQYCALVNFGGTVAYWPVKVEVIFPFSFSEFFKEDNKD